MRTRDATYVAPAQFGLARLAEKAGDIEGALDALGGIPATSRAWPAAKGHRARLMVERAMTTNDLDTLDAAAQEYTLSGESPYDLAVGRIAILQIALDAVRAGGDMPASRVAGTPATETDLRGALECRWRTAALHTEDQAERIRCIDSANLIRPRTVV